MFTEQLHQAAVTLYIDTHIFNDAVYEAWVHMQDEEQVGADVDMYAGDSDSVHGRGNDARDVHRTGMYAMYAEREDGYIRSRNGDGDGDNDGNDDDDDGNGDGNDGNDDGDDDDDDDGNDGDDGDDGDDGNDGDDDDDGGNIGSDGNGDDGDIGSDGNGDDIGSGGDPCETKGKEVEGGLKGGRAGRRSKLKRVGTLDPSTVRR
jgi:hypothetical protein